MINKLLEGNATLTKLFFNFPKHLEVNLMSITLPKDTVIYSQEEPVKFVMFITSGHVRVVKESITGHSIIIKNFKRNDILGTLEILGDEPNSACSVITSTECQMIKIKKCDFLSWFDSDPLLCRYIANIQAKTIYASSGHLIERLYYSTFLIITLYFINLIKDRITDEKVIVVQKNREEIAGELYIDIRSLNRYIKRLKDKRLLTISKGKVTISEAQYVELVTLARTLK